MGFLQTLLLYERRILLSLAVLALISGGILARRFVLLHSHLQPAPAGTYIEGSVGELLPLLPWFTVENDVNRDIVSLVFSGLQRYNPTTGDIEDDLATVDVSDDHRVYTATLRENLQWHDSTASDPHPVTADDVLFTFQSIQDPEFPNAVLRQNFLGVTITKLSDRSVRFTLNEPYRYFRSNLLLGIVPKRSFEGVPISRLHQALDVGFQPIGAGPYKLKSIVQTEFSTEVTLERFERDIPPPYHLERVVLRVFPDYQSLLSDIRNLDGIRLVPRSDDGDAILPRAFTPVTYSLPQYVALFFNLEHGIVQDRQLRLGLQLGTDRKALIDAVHEHVIVQTPLMETAGDDWRFSFDPQAAQGALFSSQWYLPEKVRLQRLLEQHDANAAGVLRLPPVILLSTGGTLTMTGTFVGFDTGATLNGLPIMEHGSGTWVAYLPSTGSGMLPMGASRIILRNREGDPLDTTYVLRTTDPLSFLRAEQEQELLAKFLRTKQTPLPPESERVTVSDMTLEDGYLRRRRSTDPIDIRINARGERLKLRILTSPSPVQYKEVAQLVAQQWRTLGVDAEVDVPETYSAFEEKLVRRDYDVLLYGQSLLDNLDSYPYWHSSGAQHTGASSKDLRIDAYNLSQYTSLKVDSLLEQLRASGDTAERARLFTELKAQFAEDVPVIVLYSPQYTFAYRTGLQGVVLGKPSVHSDRFLSLHNWYLEEERVLNDGVHWYSFFPWFFSLL